MLLLLVHYKIWFVHCDYQSSNLDLLIKKNLQLGSILEISNFMLVMECGPLRCCKYLRLHLINTCISLGSPSFVLVHELILFHTFFRIKLLMFMFLLYSCLVLWYPNVQPIWNFNSWKFYDLYFSNFLPSVTRIYNLL